MIRNNTVEHLRNDLAKVIQRAGAIEPAFAARLAGAVVGRLQQRFGGEKLYIPAASPQNLEGVKRARKAGESMPDTCKRLHISKSTYYRRLRATGLEE